MTTEEKGKVEKTEQEERKEMTKRKLATDLQVPGQIKRRRSFNATWASILSKNQALPRTRNDALGLEVLNIGRSFYSNRFMRHWPTSSVTTTSFKNRVDRNIVATKIKVFQYVTIGLLLDVGALGEVATVDPLPATMTNQPQHTSLRLIRQLFTIS